MLISRGSLAELYDDLNTCEDEAYLPPAQIVTSNADATNLLRQINGYIPYLRDSKAEEKLGFREERVRYSAGNERPPFDELED